MRKYQLEAKMLGDAKDKAIREAREALLRVDTIERRAEDAEVALRGHQGELLVVRENRGA